MMATFSMNAQIAADEIGFDGCGRDIDVWEDEDSGDIVYDFDNGDQIRGDDMFGSMWGINMTYTFSAGYAISGSWEQGFQKERTSYTDAAGNEVSRFSTDMAANTIEAIEQSEITDKDLILKILSMTSGDAQAEELQNNAKTYTDIAAMDVGAYHNDMAIIYDEGMFGYVNDCFQVVVKPKYENALPFYKEYAWVMQKGKWFKIDKEGKKVK